MTLLPVLLFILGVIILIWAIRMGNSSGKTSPEVLTILQGLAGVKKEISKVQKGLREVEGQLGDHELRLIRNENVQADLRSEVNAQKISINQLTASALNLNQPQTQPQLQHQPKSQFQPQLQQNFQAQLQPHQQPRYQTQYQYQAAAPYNSYTPANGFDNERKLQEEPLTPVLPEKYQWVLELHNQGWSVAEIAGHLSISRDAVNMVLRTAPIGKGLES